MSDNETVEKTITNDIDITKYVAFRKQELDLLRSDAFLSKEIKTKSLFQLLPRHMRRRTMGYLRKRLPHQIRNQATIKLPSKESKRPSRKHRRRPGNLVKEYERRKATTSHNGHQKMWLETHIWHAKRFHMNNEPLFGYKLPIHDNCKCKRPVYKCLQKYCCIHVSV
jgi:ribonuclease P/MRP protein subunit POP1